MNETAARRMQALGNYEQFVDWILSAAAAVCDLMPWRGVGQDLRFMPDSRSFVQSRGFR